MKLLLFSSDFPGGTIYDQAVPINSIIRAIKDPHNKDTTIVVLVNGEKARINMSFEEVVKAMKNA
jgi:uncharacterized protein with von Willebrand factor type A (vWA) domain